MGTSTSPKQFAAKIDKLGKLMNDPKVPLNATGLAGKRILETSAASAGALGVKARGKRKLISAAYDMAGDGRSVVILYRGPAHLLNNDNRAHRIEPKRPRGGRSRRKGASVLVIGGNLRAWANHPGTHGKNFFQKAKGVAVQKLPNVYAKSGITQPLKKVFG